MICRLIIYLSICLFLVTLLNPHSILHHICIWLMLSSKAAKTEGTSRIHFQNFPRAICHCSAQHVNFSCTQVRGLNLGIFIQFLAVTERERDCDFLTVLTVTWSSRVVLCPLPSAARVNTQRWLSCSTSPLWVLWDKGCWGGGWESRAQCGRAAELFTSPHPACLHSSLQCIHWDLHNSVNERSLSLPFTKS